MALSSEGLGSILSGIHVSDDAFYTVGAAILIVYAGLWGFDNVKSLLQDDDNNRRPYDDSHLAPKVRHGGDRMDAHSRYIDKYGLDAYRARQQKRGKW